MQDHIRRKRSFAHEAAVWTLSVLLLTAVAFALGYIKGQNYYEQKLDRRLRLIEEDQDLTEVYRRKVERMERIVDDMSQSMTSDETFFEETQQ